MFGIDPSIAAVKSAKIFKSHRINKVLELGAGQGRDTLYFAKQGFKIDSLDYSKKAINDISEKSINRHSIRRSVSMVYCWLSASATRGGYAG